MAVDTWNSTTSSDWTVVGSWTPAAPTASDTAYVTLAGSYAISIAASENIAIDSLEMSTADLIIDGELMLNDIKSLSTIGPAATIDRGTVSGTDWAIYDDGALASQGTLRATSSGSELAIYAATFANTGAIVALGGAAVGISSVDFQNIVAGTLTAGSYIAVGQASGDPSDIYFYSDGSLAATIVSDAATITLSGAGSDLEQYSQPTGYSGLETTLATIDATGVLNILGGDNFLASKTLADQGLLTLGGGTLSATALTVAAGGTLIGFGTVSTGVADAGRIEAQGGTLALGGGITGQGTVVIDAGAVLVVSGSLPGTVIDGGTVAVTGGVLAVSANVTGAGGFLIEGGSVSSRTMIEVGGSSSADITFSGDYEVAKLDAPHGFAGTIANFGVGDTVDLAGVAANGATLVDGMLDVTNNGTTVASLAISNVPAGVTYAMSPDGSGGTSIKASGPGLVINFVYDASVASAPAAFEQALTVAADDLGQLILNPITVNIEVGWGEDRGSGLGYALATGGPTNGTNLPYSQFKSSFIAGESAPAEVTAAANLPASDPTDGTGVYLSSAQEKAWGLLPATGTAIDGSVGFNSYDDFDWNESAGSAGWDFVGVAEHEITHALGRLSGSDLDLFSYSAPGVPEPTGYSGSPYFSVDGGKTNLDSFDTTSDAADWASGTGPDSFDAYSAAGVVNPITTTDVKLLSVLGYDVACFVSGTRIRTLRGDVAVENLVPGDLVPSALRGVAAPIVWLGHRRVDCRRHPAPLQVKPVRVRAHALGEFMPARDLLLSPDHAICTGGVLIPVRHLIDGVAITQDDTDTVTYWHVELPVHDVLFAEGLAAESYLDTGNRAGFAGGAAHLQLHPEFSPRRWDEACLPLCQSGPALLSARHRLSARAARLGWYGTTVLADGVPIFPVRVVGARQFFLLAGVKEIRIEGDRPLGLLLDGRPTNWPTMRPSQHRAVLELLAAPRARPAGETNIHRPGSTRVLANGA